MPCGDMRQSVTDALVFFQPRDAVLARVLASLWACVAIPGDLDQDIHLQTEDMPINRLANCLILWVV